MDRKNNKRAQIESEDNLRTTKMQEPSSKQPKASTARPKKRNRKTKKCCQVKPGKHSGDNETGKIKQCCQTKPGDDLGDEKIGELTNLLISLAQRHAALQGDRNILKELINELQEENINLATFESN